jgi:hypothetical protein
VVNFAQKVQRWWKGTRPEPVTGVPFTVECLCGKAVTGHRQLAHQVVACNHCGAKVFVLPQSPLPGLASGRLRRRSRLGEPNATRLWPWVVALLVASAALVVLGLLLWLPRAQSDSAATSEAVSREVGPHLAAAEAALPLGNFETALQELTLARKLPGWADLPLARRRGLAQLRRQAGLLADLLEVSLQEIVRHAKETSQAEWQLVFNRRYRGKAVLLDAEVGRDGAGQLRLEHLVRVGGAEGRVRIDDLELVQQLARQGRLDIPQRLIIGVRLEAVGQEPNGSWLFRLHAESGVLMTERSALAGACPDLLHDPDLPEVLKRQSAWMTDLPESAD